MNTKAHALTQIDARGQRQRVMTTIAVVSLLGTATLFSSPSAAQDKKQDQATDKAAVKAIPVTFPGEKLVRVNGFDMAIVERGEGPLLIILHGGIADSRAWADTIPALARDFRVVAPTMRYFGKQPWAKHWPKYSDDLHSDDIAALIRNLKSGPAHLVGWSHGARISHKVSLAHPELVRSAYLYEGVGNLALAPDAAKEDAAFNKSYWANVRPAYKKEGTEGLLREFVANVHGKGAWQKMGEQSKAMIRDNARIFQVSPRAPKTRYPCEQLRRSSVPTRLMLGTASTEPFQRMRQFYEPCMPADSIKILDGATHQWPRLEGAAFAQSVKEFAQNH